jgi:hypothetical protein
MALTRPGAYVLYKELGVNQPAQPGITYADDHAPRDIQQARPSGYVTLVLLIGERLQFRWAATPQLSPLVPINIADGATRSDQLRQAWERAVFCQEAGLGLDYWRDEFEDQTRVNTLPNLDLDAHPDSALEELAGDEEKVDEELAEALRNSRKDYYSSHSFVLPTLSRSSTGKHWSNKSNPEVITLDDDEDDDDNDLYTRPPRLRASPSSKRPYPSHHHESLQSSSPNILDCSEPYRKRARTVHPSERQNVNSVPTQKKRLPTTLDELLRQSSLNHHSAPPVSDVIEGDISQSKDFVRVLVGPGREIRNFQKKDLWNRPYFQDSRTGVNYFGLDDDNAWELRHPQLPNIDLEDFRFVAEYITDGKFGLRNPEGQDQIKEAIAQCISAWETGEKLGMDDLLEHIAEKVKFLEWDNEDVLTLAILIYRTSGPSLHAHDMMKDWISSYLAHHFWTYIKDDVVGPFFRKRLRRLPELERDVFVKRAQTLTTGAESDEDEESDEGGLGDDDL